MIDSDMQEKLAELGVLSQVHRSVGVAVGRYVENYYKIECFSPDGELKWIEEFENLVVNEGLNDSLDKHLKGNAYTATWYVGLTSGTPTVAAGDTMASHPGWSEVVAYTETARQTLVLGAVASQSVDNSASKAVFNINADNTAIGGAFLVADNAKGGTTGLLYGAGAFTGGDKVAGNGDTLNVTITCTAAAA